MAISAPIATISIGNLTVGGNGKTPFTLYLANLLRSRGYRVGIVSRGYGRRLTNRDAILVANEGKLLEEVQFTGDEPAMMAHSFDGPIAVANRRIDGMRLLLAGQRVNVILLDDAFQHSGLRRDLDLVLAGNRGFGNEWILPAGPLREPISALRRADVIVEVGIWAGDGGSRLSSHLARLGISPPVFGIIPRPDSLVKSENGCWIEQSLTALAGRRIAAACGLADSRSFEMMLTNLGAELVELMEFPDHHNYDVNDWQAIAAAARTTELLITTEKDLIKLERFSPAIESMYALRLKIEIKPDVEAQLLQIVSEKIDGRTLHNPKELAR